MQTGVKTQLDHAATEVVATPFTREEPELLLRENLVAWFRLLWDERRLISRSALAGLLVGTLLAFLLPKRFESTAQLMPPDTQSTSNMAMLAALSSRTGGALGAFAGDLLGIKNSGALFIGILRSRTVADRLIERSISKGYRSDQARR